MRAQKWIDNMLRGLRAKKLYTCFGKGHIAFCIVLVSLVLSLLVGCAGQQNTQSPAGTSTQDPPIPHLTTMTHGILDTTGTIPQSFIAQLVSRSDDVQAHGYQIAVIFFKNVASDPHQFATNVFNSNGIGFKGKDNGVLFVLYLQKAGTDGHVPWLSYITGGGISGALPDVLMDDYVQATFVPARARGDWQAGLLALYDKVYAAELDPNIASQWQAQHPQASPGTDASSNAGNSPLPITVLLLVFTAIVVWLVVSAVVASRRRENFFLTAVRLLARFLLLLIFLSRGMSSSGRRSGGFGSWGGGGHSPSSGGDV